MFSSLVTARSARTLIALCLLAPVPMLPVSAAAPDRPQRYSVEIFPSVHTGTCEQEAVVYQFDGERVRASWTRTDLLPDSPGSVNVKTVSTTRMEGTFRDGELRAEQTTETAVVHPPGSFTKDHPGGPVVRMFFRGEIEGRLQPDGRIKARVTTRATGSKALTLRTAADGAESYRWADNPNFATAPAVLDYWIPVPADNWFGGQFVAASGAQSFRLRSALERLDAHMAQASANLVAGKYDLARRQLDTVREEVADLGEQVKAGGDRTNVTFRGLPTDGIMLRREGLRIMMEYWEGYYRVANESLGAVQRELADLRHVLSGNAFKSILKNYINWSNSVPTDAMSWVAGYSPLTTIADVPRGVAGWCSEAEKDAGVLNDQFRKKRSLEELERFYEGQRDTFVAKRREVADLLRALEQGPAVEIDRAQQTFFSGLRWAVWLESGERRTAAELLEQYRGDESPAAAD